MPSYTKTECQLRADVRMTAAQKAIVDLIAQGSVVYDYAMDEYEPNMLVVEIVEDGRHSAAFFTPTGTLSGDWS